MMDRLGKFEDLEDAVRVANDFIEETEANLCTVEYGLSIKLKPEK